VKKAQYPQRSCRLAVQGRHHDHPCEIAGAEGAHPGPCASFSVKASVEKRDAWEEANPGWEKLGTFDDPFEQVKP
jgi:hypothetical protein